MRNENHNWNKHQCQSHCHNFRFSEFKLTRFNCLCFYSSDSIVEFKLLRFNCLCFYYLDSLCEFKLPRFNCLCFYSSDSIDEFKLPKFNCLCFYSSDKLDKFKLPRFNSLDNLCSHWPHYPLFFLSDIDFCWFTCKVSVNIFKNIMSVKSSLLYLLSLHAGFKYNLS